MGNISTDEYGGNRPVKMFRYKKGFFRSGVAALGMGFELRPVDTGKSGFAQGKKCREKKQYKNKYNGR